MPAASSLSLNNVAFLGAAGSAGGYVRTAFLNNAASGPGTLNDPTDPYATAQNAIAALVAAYPYEDVTVALQSSVNDFYSSELVQVLTGGGSLTVKSDNSGPWTITTFDIGNVENVDLRLDNVVVTSLNWSGNSDTYNKNAGNITGISATIGTLNINGQGPGPTGSMGSSGGGSSGANGSNGSDGSPPFAGGPGEDGSATGQNGGSATGNAAWGITLLGSGTIAQLNGYGIDALGGTGGNGGSASGGTGGNGGNATSITDPENGADGGNGGNAYASGGDGGAGIGGAGAQIFKTASWTITSSNLVGGIGTGGSGGGGGTASPGSGGAGGSGAMGGSSGNSGTSGTGFDSGGNTGASINGTAGTITTI